MVRTYIKKRNKPEIANEVIQEAVRAVSEGELSLRTAASKYGMTHTALFYQVKKFKNGDDLSGKYGSRYTSQQVFTKEQESQLVDYIIKCSKINYGMTYTNIRQLAYDYARQSACKHPEAWDSNRIAGIDWVQSFMKRHNNLLTLRKPENTSLSRATAFNKTNVMEFYDNYERALQSGEFTGDRIYNLDETGVATVVQAPKVVAQLGARQVGQAVSAERGTMITVCMIVNAVGNAVPPVFVFPRARLHDSMMFGAPPGSLGLVNSPKSSWMIGSLFIKVLEHVKKHARCSKDDRIIMLMDNHESHCTLDAIIYARENGIVLVTFPPHCTHRLQPLDVGVMGPFKGKLRVAQNDWMTSNPGKTITIHELASLTNVAYLSSFTVKNITSGFQKPGIWPFSRLAFSDEDFEPSFVNNRAIDLPNQTARPSDERAGIPESLNESEENSSPITVALSPEVVRPYPKAAPTCLKRARKKVKSRILTESPVKNKIEEETVARKSRMEKICASRLKVSFKQKKTSMKKRSISSSSDSDGVFSVQDSSDEGTLQDLVTIERNDTEEIVADDFVLTEFATKKTKVHYVGHIEEVDGLTYRVRFMRRFRQTWKFTYPEHEDYSEIERSDIIMKLPQPESSGGTARTMTMKYFDVDFSSFKGKIM